MWQTQEILCRELKRFNNPKKGTVIHSRKSLEERRPTVFSSVLRRQFFLGGVCVSFYRLKKVKTWNVEWCKRTTFKCGSDFFLNIFGNILSMIPGRHHVNFVTHHLICGFLSMSPLLLYVIKKLNAIQKEKSDTSEISRPSKGVWVTQTLIFSRIDFCGWWETGREWDSIEKPNNEKKK